MIDQNFLVAKDHSNVLIHRLRRLTQIIKMERRNRSTDYTDYFNQLKGDAKSIGFNYPLLAAG